MAKTSLFDEFNAISQKEWKQKIQFELNGADYNESLLWESPEGIKVKPFYTAEDLDNDEIPIAATKKIWKIAQNIYAGNTDMANSKALDVLERGAESLVFTIPSDEIEIERLLKGIDVERVPVHFNLQFLSSAYLKSISSATKGIKPHFSYCIDIVGHLAQTGNWYFNLERDHGLLATILGENKDPILSVDSALYQNAGANRVQQLAYSLAHAHEYLNFMENRNLLKPFNGITFKVSVGSNYFFEIAKLRALRLLWKTLSHEYNIFSDCHILATPTKRNKTIYDYNTNMLRTTTECMAAILGGADTISNLAYDALYNKDNEFGERIARNQLLLLKHESYFDKVSNPSDGSYYIEALTHQLAEKALELFKSIEKGGGFLKQLKENTIQKKIKESAEKEQLLFNVQKEILVGSNFHKNEKDRMKNSLELYPFVKTHARKTLLEPVLERRLAEGLEQKRLGDE